MAFNKNSFIPAVSVNDLTVQVVDVLGQVKYLIKEPDATLSLNGREVHVRQRSDTNLIILDFPSPRDAREAMTILQKALTQIRRNKPKNVGGGLGGAPDRYFIIPAYDDQLEFNLSFQPLVVDGLYVNGHKIDNIEGTDYEIENGILYWKCILFNLETSDIVLLEYYGSDGEPPENGGTNSLPQLPPAP